MCANFQIQNFLDPQLLRKFPTKKNRPKLFGPEGSPTGPPQELEVEGP